jgi:ribulose-phosphate 3-epimerase
MSNHQISASLLSADFARLGEEAKAVLTAGADSLHFDAMDNHFVPNLTIGPIVCAALRQYGIQADIHVHLMVKPIDRLIRDFAKAGATSIIFHAEATEHIDSSLALIRKLNCKAGLALKPETTLDCLEERLNELDMIIVMSVNPGFGGQLFIPETLDKIKKIRNLTTASGQNIEIIVDGGVKINNIAAIAEAGADTFVVGSAIFTKSNYANVIAEMHHQLEGAR